MSLSQDDELVLTAYVDGELGPIEAARFEQRLAEEPELNATLEAWRALRTALRSGLAQDLPPETLHPRIAQRGIGALPRSRPWQSLAASFVMGALLAGGLTFAALHRQGSEEIAGQMVSAHIRGLMAPGPIDIPSSDRHTIKPWFNGKLAFAPVVSDLASDGFTLAGARIDVIGLQPVATLVYSHGRHVISLTEMPSLEPLSQAVRQYREHGYLALSWSDGQIAYWAVSDTTPDELESFVRLFRAAAAGF